MEVVQNYKMENNVMINALIVSDIRIYCDGLAHILSEKGTFKSVAKARTLDDAIRVVSSLKPEVLLIDMAMLESCAVIKYITGVFTDVKVIALTVTRDEKSILLCAESGITGYVLRDSSLDDLIYAIEHVAKGEMYCPPSVAENILALVKKFKFNQNRSADSKLNKKKAIPVSILTRREREIADLIAGGFSNKQIARDLTIEVSTVKNHVHNILVKMGVKSRMRAAFVLKERFISNGSMSEI
ncbi:MAG: response regulator transcription factor [Gammaproteobacteria bacterium]|nr:response regulator transcription factor [Gammaproteobacteria bacterium]